ncbi:hypothetical protein L596_010989 [Steinernema carpocapsae]|uniref:Neurotransmitter-gated ion-channel ligand-binding domain-containing protein n=1 Tax=Steinernema carpocapsae TaxID=34508 RepID=A0A4U5NRU7_STECR|nr:hypothetical protein L596_010989 [Steinernema carpocapsae]
MRRRRRIELLRSATESRLPPSLACEFRSEMSSLAPLPLCLLNCSDATSPSVLNSSSRHPNRRSILLPLVFLAAFVLLPTVFAEDLVEISLKRDDDEDSTRLGIVVLSARATTCSRKILERFVAKVTTVFFPNFLHIYHKHIPVTYRLHDDLLRYYRKGTRPVTHPNKIVSVSMSVFLYQIIKLDAVKNTISLSGSFELFWSSGVFI